MLAGANEAKQSAKALSTEMKKDMKEWPKRWCAGHLLCFSGHTRALALCPLLQLSTRVYYGVRRRRRPAVPAELRPLPLPHRRNALSMQRMSVLFSQLTPAAPRSWETPRAYMHRLANHKLDNLVRLVYISRVRHACERYLLLHSTWPRDRLPPALSRSRQPPLFLTSAISARAQAEVKQVWRIFHCFFKQIDVGDHSLHIKENRGKLVLKREYFNQLQILEHNAFRDRMPALFTDDPNEDMSFEELVDMYSGFSPHADFSLKSALAFCIYDFDGDGKLSKSDMTKLLLKLHDISDEEIDHPKHKPTIARFPQMIKIIIRECNAELAEEGEEDIHLPEFRKAVARNVEFNVNFTLAISEPAAMSEHDDVLDHLFSSQVRAPPPTARFHSTLSRRYGAFQHAWCAAINSSNRWTLNGCKSNHATQQMQRARRLTSAPLAACSR